VIYVDSSVVLAELLVEDRLPQSQFWQSPLTSSRLLEFEVWNRIHVRQLGASHAAQAGALLRRIGFVEMEAIVLARALQLFPLPTRTLDGLHLATVEFLRAEGHEIELATYDRRLAAAAQALGVPLATL
jgi:hypothetical protein